MKKFKTLIYKNIKWIVLLFSLIIFIYIFQNVFMQQTLKIDELIYDVVINNLRTDSLTIILIYITLIGSAWVLI